MDIRIKNNTSDIFNNDNSFIKIGDSLCSITDIFNRFCNENKIDLKGHNWSTDPSDFSLNCIHAANKLMENKEIISVKFLQSCLGYFLYRLEIWMLNKENSIDNNNFSTEFIELIARNFTTIIKELDVIIPIVEIKSYVNFVLSYWNLVKHNFNKKKDHARYIKPLQNFWWEIMHYKLGLFEWMCYGNDMAITSIMTGYFVKLVENVKKDKSDRNISILLNVIYDHEIFGDMLVRYEYFRENRPQTSRSITVFGVKNEKKPLKIADIIIMSKVNIGEILYIA